MATAALARCSTSIALWWRASGGNQVLGASASMKDPRGKSDGESCAITVRERIVVHNHMSQITRYLGELGLTPVFAPSRSRLIPGEL